jgi:hypothetical protein
MNEFFTEQITTVCIYRAPWTTVCIYRAPWTSHANFDDLDPAQSALPAPNAIAYTLDDSHLTYLTGPSQ